MLTETQKTEVLEAYASNESIDATISAGAAYFAFQNVGRTDIEWHEARAAYGSGSYSVRSEKRYGGQLEALHNLYLEEIRQLLGVKRTFHLVSAGVRLPTPYATRQEAAAAADQLAWSGHSGILIITIDG